MKEHIYRESFRLPVLVFILIVFGEILDRIFGDTLPFPASLVPLIVGGGLVCWDTLLTVWRSRRITAGILVVLALIGAVFTGEYMEGAEVSLMLLLGEALEEVTVKKTRQTAAAFMSELSPSYDSDGIFFNERGDAQRLADHFSRIFLPLILFICVIVWFSSQDIRRVMTILIIACPCSLVLSSPTAVLACVGNAAKKGILLMDGGTVERCGSIKTIYADIHKHPQLREMVSAIERDGITFQARESDSGTSLVTTDNGLTLGFHQTADVLFTGQNLEALPYVLSLTRKARKIIWENLLFFACFLNLAGILLSGLGFLNPVLGALLHSASSVSVVVNSTRLLVWREKK